MWKEAKKKTADEGKTESDVVNDCLRRYLRKKGQGARTATRTATGTTQGAHPIQVNALVNN